MFIKESVISVFHIVSPLTGSKATIITTDTTSSPNHAPVFIQAAQRIVDKQCFFYILFIDILFTIQNRSTLSQNSNPRKRVYPFSQESDPNT